MFPASDNEWARSIQISRQQTRFHFDLENESREIDVKGLRILIVKEEESESSMTTKKKAKAKNDGLEILSDAHLRLQAGTHYALIGRNGTGKSTLLRALGNGLIPGIPYKTRIALLQQTSKSNDPAVGVENAGGASKRTVLQQVVSGDHYRNVLLHEFGVISEALEMKEEPMLAVRAIRKIRHERLRKELFEVQKLASLRSGARGSDARKVLIAYEKKYEDSQLLLDQEASEIDPETFVSETQAAMDLYLELQGQLETLSTTDIESKARRVLIGLGFKEPQFEKQFSQLSGGWQMRCLLAAALTQSSDLLILDEPTNYLDLFGILWLQQYLISLRETSPLLTLLLVSHDRDFVNATCSNLILLRDKTLDYFDGNLAAYEKSVRHATLRMTRMKEAQDKQISHMEKTIANNMRQGKKTGDENKIRQAKSRQKKVEDRMGMEVSAKGGRFKLNRDLPGYHYTSRAAIEIPKEEQAVTMQFPAASDLRFPGSLVSLENVSFTYAKASKPALQDVNLVIHPGDKIGVLGLNGAGKTTLINLLTGTSEPRSGTITRHPRLKIGCYSQHAVEDLQGLSHGDPTLTALSYLRRYTSALFEDFTEQAARGLLGGLGLSGRTVSDVPLSKLSGGQLVRLALATVIIESPHLLIMDEPTTHLDLPTVLALTRALAQYDGAVVLVSHDRFLLRCVVEGEPVDPEDSEDEGEEEDEIGKASDSGKGRRAIYEVKGGKVAERTGGVASWETSLEGRLKRLAL